ncbi:MAG: hypothetical protein K6U11_05955 [bacterium]|nr:hypothetical protein [bacterium]
MKPPFAFEPRAFISWSLCPEDEPFIRLIEKIARDFGFETLRPVQSEEEQEQKSLKDQMIAGSRLADCTLIATTPFYIACLCQEQNIGWKEILEALIRDFHPILAFLSPDLRTERGIHPMIQSIPLDLRDSIKAHTEYPLLQYLFHTIQQMIRQRKNQHECEQCSLDICGPSWKRYCH